jgi:diamine N-acetyltransferase
MITIKDASEADIPLISDLAEKTWWPAYSSILQPEQIKFMLSEIYSEIALRDAFKTGQQTFILLQDLAGYQGFASYGTWEEAKEIMWKIHKLYVLPENHGKGYGTNLILEITSRAKNSSVKNLVLNVNRYNSAVNFYQRIGFKKIREENIPIGPYWMNDYVMKLEIANSPD